MCAISATIHSNGEIAHIYVNGFASGEYRVGSGSGQILGTWTQGHGTTPGGNTNKLEIDYVVGASTFDATVDGVQTTGIPLSGTASTSVGGFSIQGQTPYQDQLVDNILVTVIPEPATLSVLALGGLLCWVRRRRRLG